jgi:hypothetical protein
MPMIAWYWYFQLPNQSYIGWQLKQEQTRCYILTCIFFSSDRGYGYGV